MAVGDPIPLLEVELLGSQQLQSLLASVNPNLTGGRLMDAWEDVVELLNIAVRGAAPYDLGYLIASIDDEVILDQGEITGVVFSDLFYTPFQERGTTPYWPNIDALEDWAIRHGTTAYVVARAIATRGIIPLKYFEQALMDSEDEIVQLVGQVVAEILEREY